MMPRERRGKTQVKLRKERKEKEKWWVRLEAEVKKTSESGHLSTVK